MRITNPQITALMHGSMNSSSAKLGKLMQQMATGQRMLLPSDDPIASVRVLRIQREEASLEQYRGNIANLAASFSKQEANLKSISDAMLSVRDLLLWAANSGVNSEVELGAIASELEVLEKTLINAANVRDEEGRYLFSGTQSDRPAIVFDEDSQSYVLGGNAKHRQAAVANGVLLEENVTAEQAFGPTLAGFNDLRQVVALLKSPDLNAADAAVNERIAAALESLDRTHDAVLGAMTELGGRQNTLTLLNNSNEGLSLVNQKIEQELSTLDYAGASIDFSNYLLALQSTQKTYLKLNGLSLFGQL